MTEVADLYVVLRSVGGQFNRGMAEAGAAAAGADSKISGMAVGVGRMAVATVAAGVTIGIAAVKMSSEFDRLMELLHTLAHVPQSQIKPLGDAVLNLAGQVGYSPNSLAAALYHIESTFASVGITGKKAMDILKVASEGAQIGGADLVDVVNALDATIVSGIGGVKNISQAMNTLLSIVGAGDMTMQQFADSMGTGILAMSKQFGVTLPDVGAAIATFGDNMIRGSKAATDLRMVIMDLAKQSEAGQKKLSKLGFTSGELGKDMRKGGLLLAIEDLHKKLDKAGVTGTAVGAILADIFTKRSAAPLAILLGELGQFTSKYPELKKGAHEFGDAWAHTSSLISTRAKMAKANIESAFINLGHALTPIASTILGYFNKAFEWAKTHKKTVEEISKVIKTVFVGALIIAAAYLAVVAAEAIVAAAPFLLIAFGIGLLAKKLVDLYEHNAKFHAFVTEIVNGLKKEIPVAIQWFKNAFHEAEKVVDKVIHAIISFYKDHKTAINKMIQDVVGLLKDFWTTFKLGFQALEAVVHTIIKIIIDLWDRFGRQLWKHFVTAWNAIVQILRGAMEVMRGIFDVIKGILTGKWSELWKGITEIFGGAWNMMVGLLKYILNSMSVLIGASMAAISAAWGLVWHWIEDLAGYAWEGIKKIGQLMFEWYVQIPWKILKALGGAGMWLFRTGEDILWGLLRGITEGAMSLWNWIGNLPGEIWYIVSDAGTWLINAGEELVRGLWNGISRMGGWLWKKVKGFFSSILGGILSFLHIGSPSKLMADLVGKNMVLGIAQGITENQHHVYNALKQLANRSSGMKLGGPDLGLLGGGGALGYGNIIYYVTVQGQLVDTAGFFRAMQTATQQHGARNSSNGLVFTK